MKKNLLYITAGAGAVISIIVFTGISNDPSNTSFPSEDVMSMPKASTEALELTKENSPEFYNLMMDKNKAMSDLELAIKILEEAYLGSIEKSPNTAADYAMSMAGLYKDIPNMKAFDICMDEALRIKPDYSLYTEFRDRVLQEQPN